MPKRTRNALLILLAALGGGLLYGKLMTYFFRAQGIESGQFLYAAIVSCLLGIIVYCVIKLRRKTG